MEAHEIVKLREMVIYIVRGGGAGFSREIMLQRARDDWARIDLPENSTPSTFDCHAATYLTPPL